MHNLTPGSNAASPARALFSALIFIGLAFAILALPVSLARVSLSAFAALPLELFGILLLMLLARGILLMAVRAAATGILVLLLLLKLADFGTGAAFQRPFNPYLDIKMLADGWNLLSGSVGLLQAILILGLALFGAVLVAATLYWTSAAFGRATGRSRAILVVACLSVLAIGWSAMQSGQSHVMALRTTANLPAYLNGRLQLMVRSVADIRTFEQQLLIDPLTDDVLQPRFGLLEGRDLVVIFIESYGQTALTDPRYSATVNARLLQVQAEIEGRGLHSASALLKSPTVGGLSWLAHGTFLSGLWIDSQARYNRLVTSSRSSLNALFAQAGWKTVAVMPAITMDWPEAAWFGYEAVHAAADLGYRGKPFNWVTMPDQFTLSAFERLERGPGHPPVMAEIALISSHAPWTPIPDLIEWESVGDGTVFNDQAERGDPPSVVWSDPKRVQAQYLKSIDYTLETLGSYMTRFGRNTVFILVGDHQPAAIITGPDASRAVPVHIVTDDPALLQNLDQTVWSNGLLPPDDKTLIGMDRMRDMVACLFTAPERQGQAPSKGACR